MTHKGGHHPHAEQRGAEDRNNPVYLHLGKPSLPEECSSNEVTGEEQCRQSKLWLRRTMILGRWSRIGNIARYARDGQARKRAESKPHVRKACDSDIETVLLLKDSGEGGKEEVEVTKQHRCIDRKQENDG